jgi:hypothetical protein
MLRLVKAIYAWSATLYIAEWFASYGPFVWSCTVGTVTMVSWWNLKQWCST